MNTAPILRTQGRSSVLGWNTHIHRCPWCRSKAKPTHVEFYGVTHYQPGEGWRLAYPRPEIATICVVSHEGCGPDLGYWFLLDDLAKEPNDWYRQLREKDWTRSLPLKDVIWDLLILHRKDAYGDFHPARREVVA